MAYQTATLSLSADEAETTNIDLRVGTSDSTGNVQLYLTANDATSLVFRADTSTPVSIESDLQKKIDLSSIASDLQFIGRFNTLDVARSAGSFASGTAVTFASDVNILLVSGMSGSVEMQIELTGVGNLSADNLNL